eukprot:1595908-Heterocapsa_arctica.AAC.1
MALLMWTSGPEHCPGMLGLLLLATRLMGHAASTVLWSPEFGERREPCPCYPNPAVPYDPRRKGVM